MKDIDVVVIQSKHGLVICDSWAEAFGFQDGFIYEHIEDEFNAYESGLYRKAKCGDEFSMRLLMEYRCNAEYEHFEYKKISCRSNEEYAKGYREGQESVIIRASKLIDPSQIKDLPILPARI